MRNNLPVTQQEYLIPEGETLVSTTDLDSRITYCNPSFIRVSGYAAEELHGQPHNLIRHPDMPAEAFRDMWATLKAGKPWSQLVKNRRKDGDHYWVRANVTPVLEHGRAVGYMSVRTRPARNEIAAAERLYATMRAEAQRGRLAHVVREGEVMQAGWRGRCRMLGRPGIAARIALAMAGVVLVAPVLAALGGPAPASAWTLALQAAAVVAATAWLHRGIARPLHALALRTNRMAAGELASTRSPQRHDEVGALMRGLDQLNVNLQAMVNDVRRESDHVDGAAGEIASASQDLSARTEAQAGSLQETAAAMEQVSATMQRNAGHAAEANQRAGEAGRGFAVVAAEVRALAGRSADAARQIRQLVDASQVAVRDGAGTAMSASRTLGDVVDAARDVGQLVDGITTASTEQAAGIGEVNAAVALLDTGTQQNAAMVEEASASAQQLRHQARVLAQAVGIFKVAAA